MANPSASNVAVGKPKATGGVYSGATTATLPTNASTSIDASLTALGYVGEDGLTQSKGTDITKVHAWGGDVVKVLQTTDELTYTWNFLGMSRVVFQEVFGTDDVSWVDANGTQKIAINSTALPSRAYVFEMLDGATALRIVVPNGQITNIGDVTFADGNPISFPVTLECFPDSSGNKAYWYFTKFYS